MNKSLLTLLCLTFPLNVMATQTCQDDITESTPDSRFIINGDGTATDKNTGLMWMRCSLGQTWEGGACTGSPTKHNWQQALSSGEAQNFAGQDDWRLPNIKELNSIVEDSCYLPAINASIFPNTPSPSEWTTVYRSSSTTAKDNSLAWVIVFDVGFDNNNYPKNSGLYVRLVRGGE